MSFPLPFEQALVVQSDFVNTCYCPVVFWTTGYSLSSTSNTLQRLLAKSIPSTHSLTACSDATRTLRYLECLLTDQKPASSWKGSYRKHGNDQSRPRTYSFPSWMDYIADSLFLSVESVPIQCSLAEQSQFAKGIHHRLYIVSVQVVMPPYHFIFEMEYRNTLYKTKHDHHTTSHMALCYRSNPWNDPLKWAFEDGLGLHCYTTRSW